MEKEEEKKPKENEAMKKVELNRIVEFLRRKSSDEKTPFAQSAVQDNGTISKNFDSKDGCCQKELSSESDKLDTPMSLPRKFCIVMSFNAWVLYFLVLGWIVPCRQPVCPIPYDTWEKNLSGIWPLTNIETFNGDNLPSLVFIGYSKESPTLTALDADGGSYAWSVTWDTTNFIPRKINCNFRTVFDVNEDGVGDCLLASYYDLFAFNATNGHIFWMLNYFPQEGNIVSQFQPTRQKDGKSFLIGVRGNKIVVLDNGTRFTEVDLPCSSPLDIQILDNAINGSFTLWNFVCDYGDKVEAWALPEHELLKKGNSKNPDHATEFSLLYSGTNYDGSMDFGCDVTTESSSLLLSWSDRVVMVTASMSIAWERHFPFPLSVTSLKVGHFLSGKEKHIAVSLENDTNSQISFLEMKNGSIISTLKLKDKVAQTLYKIPGSQDILVLKSLLMNYTTQPVNNYTDPIPMEKTNFVMIQAENRNFSIWEITTLNKIHDSVLNIRRDGEADLLVMKNEEENKSLINYIVQKSPSKGNLFCGKHSSTSVVPEL